MDDPGGHPHDPPPRRPPPLPVASLDHSRVAQLAYASVLHHKRPGIVTAVGVLSLVFGAIGVLGNAMSVVSVVLVWAFVNRGGLTPAAPPPRTQVTRQELIASVEVFSSRAAMTDTRQTMLRAFLAQNATLVFDLSKGVTAGDLQDQITSATTDDGSTRFILTNGLLDVGDGYVAWKSGNIVTPGTLSDEDVEQVLLAVGRAVRGAPTADQYDVLKRALNRPGQVLIDPAKRPVANQIAGATMSPDGVLTVFSADGRIWIPGAGGPPMAPAQVGAVAVPTATVVVRPGGGVMVTARATTRTAVATTGPAGAATPAPTPAPTTVPATGPATTIPLVPGLTPWTLLATLAHSIVNTALAVYLLAAGVLVFRLSQGARRHHVLYAWLKIVVTVVAALGWWSVSASGWTAGSFILGWGGGNALIWFSTALVPILYPISVLLVMNARGVREYFAGLGT